MAIGLRGVGAHGTKEGAGNAVPGLPAGWQPGDIHFLLAATSRNDEVPLPAGYTSLVAAPDVDGITDLTVRLAWCRAQEGDAAPSIACTAANSLTAQIAGFSGAKAAGDPWHKVGETGETPNPIEAASITTTVPGCAILFAALTDNDFAFSGWSGEKPAFTELFDSLFNAATAKDSTIGLAWGLQEAAGATGPRTVAQSSGATLGVGYLLALEPAAGAVADTRRRMPV